MRFQKADINALFVTKKLLRKVCFVMRIKKWIQDDGFNGYRQIERQERVKIR